MGCNINDKGDKLVLTRTRMVDVSIINMDSLTTKNICFLSKAFSDINLLWHKCLSHMNFKTLNDLSKREPVNGLTQHIFAKEYFFSLVTCERGMQTKASFKSKQASPLHLLHMDLFGPVFIQSIGRKKYTLVIVDEFSRYTWTFFLKSKSDKPEEIVSRINKVEMLNNQTMRSTKSDHSIEYLRTDID